MNIIPVAALSDNYIWLLQQDQQVVAVDPGEAEPVIDYLNIHQLYLSAIWLTHNHADHIGGVTALTRAYPQCRVYGQANWKGVDQTVMEGSQFAFFGRAVTVWHIPGHTFDHLAYLLTDTTKTLRVFCGDTLLSAGCGRVFSGTMAQLYSSLQRLASLPATTLFFPAHEYTVNNLHFALAVEANNSHIQEALQTATIPTLPVTLAHEQRVNPFIRLQQPAVMATAIRHGLPADKATQPLAVFTFLREWKNQF